MRSRIIYILCHNDETERISHLEFDKYSWARIYRIPKESQTYLMESVMYNSELMKLYDEWKDCKYVGTLSYKLPARLAYPPFSSMENISNLVETANGDVVSFRTYDHSYSDSLPNFCKILTDTCVRVGIKLNHSPKYNILSRKVESKNALDMPCMFHNYWMTSPSLMLAYINFFNYRWLPALDSHPNVWDDSHYPYNLPKDELKTRMLELTRGRASHYPFHAIICEVIPTHFFRSIGATITF